MKVLMMNNVYAILVWDNKLFICLVLLQTIIFNLYTDILKYINGKNIVICSLNNAEVIDNIKYVINI